MLMIRSWNPAPTEELWSNFSELIAFATVLFAIW